jgi:single-stranded-DNA-specific exonuclease
MTTLLRRNCPESAYKLLLQACYPAPLAKIYAARNLNSPHQLNHASDNLYPPDQLRNIGAMASHLANAIAARKKLLIVADYDADGATACAVAVRGLRLFGAQVDFIVPNRFEYDYGLTPEIVRLASQSAPDILITVDNGIASVEGVAEAHRLGMQVLITDHHLPGDILPDATCIVNPNQPGCNFPSKHLAGVGVMFYVLLALRAELRKREAYTETPEPNLGNLLDLVALGTVADVVKLDHNNRILVQQGLLRIRAGKACAGVRALFQVAKKDLTRATSQDLGFFVAPRLNAAGRLEDMSLGIHCLLADDDDTAQQIAIRLDAINQERRHIEASMQAQAGSILESVRVSDNYSLVLFNEQWHQGVIGILASRLKDKHHRPTIIFALSENGELKGSGRSIPGLHLRDALDMASKRHPSLIRKFGGHAAAAGLTIARADYAQFAAAFEQVARELLSEADLHQVLESDGALNMDDINLELAQQLDQQVWGQGFPMPLFDDDFIVHRQRVVGDKHLKLSLQKSGKMFEAMLFGYAEPLPDNIHAAYSLTVNEFNGRRSVLLIIRHWE